MNTGANPCCNDCGIDLSIIADRPICDGYGSATGICRHCGHGLICHTEVARELRKLRAAVETVKELPLYAPTNTGVCEEDAEGEYLFANHVLEALEVE